MRILQVFSEYSNLGGEHLWVDQISKMTGEGFEVSDLRFRSKAWKGARGLSVLQQSLYLNRNPHAINRLVEEVEWTLPDVILFHNVLPVGSVSLYAEARKHGKPIIRYIHNFRPFSPSGTLWVGGRNNDSALRGNVWPEILHGSWEKSRLKTALLSLFQRKLSKPDGLAMVDHWIAVSDFTRERFIEAGVPEERITTLRHCWNLSPLEEPAAEGDYYLFLGRLVAEKGIDTLFTAWDILSKTMKGNTPRLLIAGHGPEQKRVVKAAARNPNIEYVGFVNGQVKRDYLRGCRGLLAPSIWWEPLGLIVYEAYEVEKPVIAARSGGLIETVTEGSTGLFHNPGDGASLAEAVRQMEELGPAARAEIGQAGRLWLQRMASPAQWKDDFRNILNRTIQRYKQPES